MIAPPDRDLLRETDALLGEIQDFQARSGRAVHKGFKRTRKARPHLEALAALGPALPEDFRALYWNHNGASGARLSMWEMSVFFDWRFPDAAQWVAATRIARIERHAYADDKLAGFIGTDGVSLDLFPAWAEGGETPLVATLPWSTRAFIAFDSTRAMLRTVVAAQQAGCVRHREARAAAPDASGRIREKGEVVLDLPALRRVVAAHNGRADYWDALLDGDPPWDGEPPAPPADGVVRLDPAVREIVFGPLRDALADRAAKRRDGD